MTRRGRAALRRAATLRRAYAQPLVEPSYAVLRVQRRSWTTWFASFGFSLWLPIAPGAWPLRRPFSH